jgi:hypothetical protein
MKDPESGLAGCVHEILKRFSPRLFRFSKLTTTLATRDVLKTPRFRRPHPWAGRFAV